MSLAEKPIKLASLTVKNRFLRSATMENMAGEKGEVTDALLKLYRELAAGGVGLIVSGATAVAEQGKAWKHQLGAWSDAQLDGLAQLAQAAKEHGEGAAMAPQLHHNGSAGLGYSYGGVEGGTTLADLSPAQIKEKIKAFGLAAGRVKKAGFHAVAVHGAHGYLLSEFLSPALNPRSDEWGGSQENRLRFPLAVARAIKEAVGDDFPLLWKINSRDYVDNGGSPEEYADAAAALAGAGVDLVEISGGVKDQVKLRSRLKKEAGEREAYFSPALAVFRAALPDTPLAVTGGLRGLPAVEALLAAGADMVGMSRPLIHDPGLINRFLRQQNPQPSGCKDCCKCLLTIAQQPLACHQ